MWMWLCQGNLKVKIALFRLPSASQKRVCLIYNILLQPRPPGSTRRYKCVKDPGFGRVKPPLCSGGRGGGRGFQLTDAQSQCRIWLIHLAPIFPICAPFNRKFWRKRRDGQMERKYLARVGKIRNVRGIPCEVVFLVEISEGLRKTENTI